MKRAEKLAWSAMVGLIVITGILITGGIMYNFTAFWAGAMLTGGQAIIVGLAAWGLSLARQTADLEETPATRPGAPAPSGFRMSLGDDVHANTGRKSVRGNIVNEEGSQGSEVRSLEVGLQRIFVFSAGLILTILAGLGAWLLIYNSYVWAKANPDQSLPIAGTFKAPFFLDELALVLGLACAAIYATLYWLSRPKPGDGDEIEGTRSNFVLGITAMSVFAAACVLGYLRVAGASEVAAGIMIFFMALQGLELIANAFRSYSSIEELDQEAIDLHATPIVPMLESVWLTGLRMLFAQSMGLSSRERRERGVIARMMPRALIAIVVIAIIASCFRVVKPGTVAVIERLGYAQLDENGLLDKSSLLYPGLHLTLPWPIDQLVVIPTEELKLTTVGKELHGDKAWGSNFDFQFWSRRETTEAEEEADEFITGDLSPETKRASPQLLETYVEVRWRVIDPLRFYTALSHSEFYDKSGDQTKALPIYEAVVQACTSFAVTHAFAIHSLEQVMINDRTEVEHHCQKILQDKLDSLGGTKVKGSGIEIVSLTIKDLHPPYWRADVFGDNTAPEIAGYRVARGPASAFEFVVSAREFMHTLVNRAEGERIEAVNRARGEGQSEIARAKAYLAYTVAEARGESGRISEILRNITSGDTQLQINLLKQQLLFDTAKEVLDPIPKVIVDPRVNDLYIFQAPPNGAAVRPPGGGG